jgi:arylsulfatase A-like enzyme
MRCIYLLFDSLNLRALSCYGGGDPTPNFDRLAARAVTFDRHYIGSMPCMPARRDMHTGRLNFLHRSWGPLEPFDNSFPELLKAHDVYSHLVSDHYHYFEDGGATYHSRYTTWDFIRGQEADPWIAMVKPPLERFREHYHPVQIDDARGGFRFQNLINRTQIVDEADFPSVKCFDQGLGFLRANKDTDNWLLQIETFDPHEPFVAPARLRDRFKTAYQGPILDWPRYKRVDESAEEIAELNANYRALVALCDEQLGRVLDVMDESDMWSDTCLILTTDHGFLLSEHDWWGKNCAPFYNEIANIPLFVHHPEHALRAGQRINALTTNVDIMPTMLDVFGAPLPEHVSGKSLLGLMRGEHAGHQAILYGIFGGAINITDGRYTYFRYPADMEALPLNEYTMMPTHMHCRFSPEELRGATLAEPFAFTKGVPVMRIPSIASSVIPPRQGVGMSDTTTVLFDLETDPTQRAPIDDHDVEARLCAEIRRIMGAHDAPLELYDRFDLPCPTTSI